MSDQRKKALTRAEEALIAMHTNLDRIDERVYDSDSSARYSYTLSSLLDKGDKSNEEDTPMSTYDQNFPHNRS